MSNNAEIWKDWGRLQTSDHYYYMCTKWFSDGAVHKYFNPYASPYEAFINYMNVLSDFMIRLDDSLIVKEEETVEPEVEKAAEPLKKAPVKKTGPKAPRKAKLKPGDAIPEVKKRGRPPKKSTDEKPVKKVKIKKEPIKTFDINEILDVSDGKIKEIIKDLPIETVSYAMKGADKEVMKKVEKNLGKKTLKIYNDLLKQLKNIKSAEVKKYRKEIIQKIRS